MESLQLSALDLRLGLMALVLAAMAVVFHVLTGTFLTPENLYNIAQQTAVVGIVAAAIVLVIVARHIDLSVGSVMGFVGVLIAWLQYTHGWHWGTACAVGLLASLVVGLYQGWLTAYIGVPSFVVTLGGLMSFRGAAFLVADGKTQPVTDPAFLAIGGGLDGALGVRGSWTLAALVAVGIVWRVVAARRARARHGFASRPAWADALFTGSLLALLAGFTAAMCHYQLPGKDGGQGIPAPVLIWAIVVVAVAFIVRRTRFGRYVFAIGGNPEAALLCHYQLPGKDGGQGIPAPVLIWAIVVVAVAFIVRRTRFGRYVFAIGGNPEAALLVGIRVRRVTLQLFLLLAVLVAVAAAVSVARLNAGTNSMGSNMELYVIAAAVIGGVSLAGGSGTILGSVLGALIIQFLDSGLLLMDVSIGKRMVIIGQVLIVAVVFDVLYRRFSGERLA